ncbi:protein KRI1 homolog [Pieris brassicae]|uniref:protein KRI1 homolog n=1 Tax=Pieris brassicae TaxID=7116 RepID=UPI001E65F31C|nr:protein KRI1 homolog [Pieris brassicae]
MTKKKLFDEDSEEDEADLKTENNYAKNYDRWREKEELHKLEQKYGQKPSSDVSGTDSEDESDELPEISEEVETQFLKTLSLLKTKDPRVYDPNYKFFNEKVEKEKEITEDVKKVTFADSDEDDDNPNIFNIEKKAVIEDPAKTEDGKLKKYLTGKADHINEEIEKDLEPLKALWSDPKLNDGEAFLRDYILHKRYLDTEEAEKTDQKIRDDEDLEADEKTVEEQGKFERAYNFRFEEPDDEYLKRYPRTMNFIRPKDDRRSRKRAEIAQRKEEEKKKKMEEIGRMKALKLKEIQEKIAKIKEVTGNEELAFEEADIEGDFDPAEHDRRMKAIFDEQFYGEADDEKPVFPDLDEELEIENWDKFNLEQDNRQNEDGLHCEDEDFNMDADYDPKVAKENLVEELKRDQNKKRRNRKRKSKLAEILAQEKPKFAPQVEKSYAEYMEEYYKMDCEDVIGDLPTRFKYRDVVPNDFGLSIEEILLADDKELTQWVPLKKLVKYRPENIEKSEVNTYRQKAADERLKKKILPSLFKDLPEEPEIVVPVEETILKKKKKKKKNKSKSEDATPTNDTILENQKINSEATIMAEPDKKSKKKKNRESTIESNSVTNELSNVENEDNLISQEINCNDQVQSKKKRNTQSTEEGNIIPNDLSNVGNEDNLISQDINSKNHIQSKKKKKAKNTKEGNIITNELSNVGNEDNLISQDINSKNHIQSKKKKKAKNTIDIVKDNSEHIEISIDDNTKVGKITKDTDKKSKKKHKKVLNNEIATLSVTSSGEINENKSQINGNLDNVNTKNKIKKTKHNKFIVEDVTEASNKASTHARTKNTQKRKANVDNSNIPRKKNKNKKQWKSHDKNENTNPLAKLSDERLKAYGLNPKKYRSFLKYKKF